MLFRVPNLPCGVERIKLCPSSSFTTNVPNLPCGVESFTVFANKFISIVFLIYRVELKVVIFKRDWTSESRFLIYRVELKVEKERELALFFGEFLIYRVELKEETAFGMLSSYSTGS